MLSRLRIFLLVACLWTGAGFASEAHGGSGGSASASASAADATARRVRIPQVQAALAILVDCVRYGIDELSYPKFVADTRNRVAATAKALGAPLTLSTVSGLESFIAADRGSVISACSFVAEHLSSDCAGDSLMLGTNALVNLDVSTLGAGSRGISKLKFLLACVNYYLITVVGDENIPFTLSTFYSYVATMCRSAQPGSLLKLSDEIVPMIVKVCVKPSDDEAVVEGDLGLVVSDCEAFHEFYKMAFLSVLRILIDFNTVLHDRDELDVQELDIAASSCMWVRDVLSTAEKALSSFLSAAVEEALDKGDFNAKQKAVVRVFLHWLHLGPEEPYFNNYVEFLHGDGIKLFAGYEADENLVFSMAAASITGEATGEGKATGEKPRKKRGHRGRGKKK